LGQASPRFAILKIETGVAFEARLFVLSKSGVTAMFSRLQQLSPLEALI
jgi:hypothetical protein